jgi:hypothetical protein
MLLFLRKVGSQLAFPNKKNRQFEADSGESGMGTGSEVRRPVGHPAVFVCRAEIALRL